MCQFIETIRIERGVVYNLDYHTERMNQTRAVFWPDEPPLNLSESHETNKECTGVFDNVCIGLFYPRL